MFEDGRVEVHPMVAEIFREPRPVQVDLDALLIGSGRGFIGANGLPMIVRAQGIRLQAVDGAQHAWLRTNLGHWVGLVTFTVPSQLGDLPCRSLLPAAAFRLTKPDDGSESGPSSPGAS
ncbi:hypothetical protein [Saccharopolyspora sp. 5N708]|uniref:hypothetical protein n=1 Tax=Saccharopolyspora sp. 5N708 TaxID=3457424 RepID=UPI003FD51B76